MLWEIIKLRLGMILPQKKGEEDDDDEDDEDGMERNGSEGRKELKKKRNYANGMVVMLNVEIGE